MAFSQPSLAQDSQFDLPINPDVSPNINPLGPEYQDRGLSEEAVLLNGDAVLKAFKGITHDGSYAFTREGRPTRRFVETTFETGLVEHVQGDKIDKGTWTPGKNRICFTYFTDLNGGCFQIYRVKNCYFHFPFRNGRSQNRFWTARTVFKGETPDCEDAVA